MILTAATVFIFGLFVCLTVPRDLLRRPRENIVHLYTFAGNCCDDDSKSATGVQDAF